MAELRSTAGLHRCRFWESHTAPAEAAADAVALALAAAALAADAAADAVLVPDRAKKFECSVWTPKLPIGRLHVYMPIACNMTIKYIGNNLAC